MKALFLQSFGIGDCIFSIGIAKHFMEQGYEIIWPVLSHFKEGLQRAYPFIKWQDSNAYSKYMGIQTKCVVDNMLIVPIRWSMEAMKCEYKHVMRAKYDMYGLDWQKWKEAAMWHRDIGEEESLYYFAGGHMIDEPYSLVFDKFGSNFQYTNRDTWDTTYIPIKVQNMEGYSFFDWAALIERASEISAVSSSNIYIFELLDIKCPIHIYKREPLEKDHRNYDYLLTKDNYILH